MAFGLSPKYIQNLPLENLTPEQFLAIAIEVAKQLGWNVGHTDETGFVAYTKFSMISWGEEVKVKIRNNVADLKSECTGNQIVDWGRNKRNIENFILIFNELKNSFSPEQLIQKYEEFKPNLVFKGQEGLVQPPPATKEKITSLFAILKPTSGYFSTPLLIILNIGIFILMVITGVNVFLPDNESLISWGANFGPVTLHGGWWRLIANCFLHIGILHLLMNTYALLYIGLLLEPHLGSIWFVLAYILTGVTASITSVWWHPFTISAGASGAIFGMYGIFLAMLTTNFIEKSARRALLISIGVFVVYNLVNGLKGGIDNAAHIGGLLGGLIIGYAFYPSLKKPDKLNLKYGTLGFLTVLVISTSFIAYKKIPNGMDTYNERIKEFVSMESMAMEVYKLPRNTPKDELLYEIRERGIYYWNENIKLLNELDELSLPEQIHDRNKKSIDYCNLRIKSYNFIYKMVNEDTDKYKDSIEFYNKKIQSIIDDLKQK